MIRLASVTHDIKSNTLEALWLEETLDGQGNVTDIKPHARRNYSPEQKSDFLADTGDAGLKYVNMAGW